jgi:hypothetical protein
MIRTVQNIYLSVSSKYASLTKTPTNSANVISGGLLFKIHRKPSIPITSQIVEILPALSPFNLWLKKPYASGGLRLETPPEKRSFLKQRSQRPSLNPSYS